MADSTICASALMSRSVVDKMLPKECLCSPLITKKLVFCYEGSLSDSLIDAIHATSSGSDIRPVKRPKSK